MSDVESRQPPLREARLGALHAYGGGACGARDTARGGCRLTADRAFSQGSICQLLPTVAILGTMPDTVVIVHGSVGCGGAANSLYANVRGRRIADGDPNPRGTVWLSTALGEREVVGGAEGILRAAVLEADARYRPRTIVVASTCVPGVIGDDVPAITEELAGVVSAEIITVLCEGFRTKIMSQAQDSVYHGVAQALLRTPPEDDEYGVAPEEQDRRALDLLRRTRQVTLCNNFSVGPDDERELSRLLEALGLEVAIFPCYSSLDVARDATRSALAVSTCPAHDDYFLEFLSERYGVPSALSVMPIGVANTRRWLDAVADALGLQEAVARLAEREEAELAEALAPILPQLKGKRAVLSAGEVRTLSTAGLLTELGMEVVAVRPYHLDVFGAPGLEDLVRTSGDVPVNVAPIQPFETAALLERVGADVYLGHVGDNVWAAKAGLPVLPMFGGPHSYCGYAGAFDIARRLVRVLANPSFNRHLAENVAPLYRPEWLAGDPFALLYTND